MAQLQRVNTIFKVGFVFCLALMMLFIVQGSLYIFTEGVDYQGDPITVEIPQGTSSGQIARILEEEGVVKNALIFRYYARYKGLDSKLQAGEYLLYPNMHPGDALEKLLEGRIYRDQIRFTVPEGLHAEQLAARLESAGLGDKDTFLELMANPAQFSYSFLEDVPVELEYPLEGYLSPDTYFVFEEATEEDVLKIMLRKFDSFYTQEVRDRIDELGYSLHEVVTLASIVEREAQVSEERPMIAAVFLNRLDKRHPLESCATVQYALGEVKPVLSIEDTRVESDYNTYIYPGLPPGPIASPGMASLEAVLYPADVDYLFFRTKDDGTGAHYFAVDYAGHRANSRKASENRKLREDG